MRRAIRKMLRKYKKAPYTEFMYRLIIWHPCGTVDIQKDGFGCWEALLRYAGGKIHKWDFSLGSPEEWIEEVKKFLHETYDNQLFTIEVEIYECLTHKRIYL